MIPKPLRTVGTVTNLASSATIGALRLAIESKRKRVALPCGVCRGKGFYMCKLCKGNATIQWSPLYDPIVINPCLFPTCDGNRSGRFRFRFSHVFQALPLARSVFDEMPNRDLVSWNASLSGYSQEGETMGLKRFWYLFKRRRDGA